MSFKGSLRLEENPLYLSLQASVLQNIRTAMRRQMRRHSSRRNSSRRRLGRLWNRFFHRPRARGQIPLLHPTHTSQTVLGDGIINHTDVTTTQSLPPSPEGADNETETCSPERELQESESNNLQSGMEAVDLPSSDASSNTCPAVLADSENGHSDKPVGADAASSSEARQTSKVDSGKTFRDPLSERVTEIHPCGGSVARRTVAETRSSNRSNLLTEEPCRLPFKKWESVYSDSSMNVPTHVEGQHCCCPHSYHEEPLGIHPACCHSMEVPILESPPPLSEISPSDDESLLVC